MSFTKASNPATQDVFWRNRFPWNNCFMWQIIPKRFQMLKTSVNTWVCSSCYHCPFWFPLVFFPWDQGNLFLVQGLVKWGVAIVTDSWYKLSPSAIPGAGKGTFPEMGQQLRVPRHCSAQGTLKTAQDSQGDAQCIWNSQEAAWVPAVGNTHILLPLLAQ